jgi:hypothetical protein
MAEIADEIQRFAERAVEASECRPGDVLDYTQESLATVEDMLDEVANYANEMSPDELTQLSQSFGCYILEVGRRSFGGRYLWHDQRDQPVLVVGEPDFRVSILTWDKVRGRIGGDSGDNIPFFYTGFAERVRSASAGIDVLYV